MTLPDWAAKELDTLQIPDNYLQVSDTKLPNGIRLIVRTDTTSPTVTVMGSVEHNGDLQSPQGQDGVGDILDGLYSYGTTSLDRLAFAKALDDIAANENAGYGFSVKVLKEYFSRGVQLLADNELHPALPEQAFKITQQQTRAVCCRQSAKPRLPLLARARSRSASLRRSRPARSHA